MSKTGEWISQVLPAAHDQCPLRRAAPVAQLEVEGFCVEVFGLGVFCGLPAGEGMNKQQVNL